MAGTNPAGVGDADSQVRLGQVVAYTSSLISVRLSGGAVEGFPYQSTYRPIVGETTVLVRQGSGWLVTGGLNAMPPDNPVVNGSFEAGSSGAGAPGWGVYHDPGSSFATTFVTNEWLAGAGLPPPSDGGKYAQLTASVSPGAGVDLSDDYVYSSPIPVAAGQRWAASAQVGFEETFGWFADGISNRFALLLTWYAKDRKSVV